VVGHHGLQLLSEVERNFVEQLLLRRRPFVIPRVTARRLLAPPGPIGGGSKDGLGGPGGEDEGSAVPTRGHVLRGRRFPTGAAIKEEWDDQECLEVVKANGPARARGEDLRRRPAARSAAWVELGQIWGRGPTRGPRCWANLRP